MRKHYIDNLKWMLILVLIPYHVGMSFNSWDEPNYIMLDSDKLISSFLVFFSPWFILLLIKIIGNPPMKIASVYSFIIFALWIPLPFISDILSIGGKSLFEYTYLFLAGYYIFSNDATLDLLENKRKLTLMIGLISSGTNIYMYV